MERDPTSGTDLLGAKRRRDLHRVAGNSFVAIVAAAAAAAARSELIVALDFNILLVFSLAWNLPCRLQVRGI